MLTAVLPGGSSLAAELAPRGDLSILEFDQFRQFYRLTAAVSALPKGDPLREASLWHNRIFNPALPNDVEVLGFQPNWSTAEARPAP